MLPGHPRELMQIHRNSTRPTPADWIFLLGRESCLLHRLSRCFLNPPAWAFSNTSPKPGVSRSPQFPIRGIRAELCGIWARFEGAGAHPELLGSIMEKGRKIGKAAEAAPNPPLSNDRDFQHGVRRGLCMGLPAFWGPPGQWGGRFKRTNLDSEVYRQERRQGDSRPTSREPLMLASTN